MQQPARPRVASLAGVWGLCRRANSRRSLQAGTCWTLTRLLSPQGPTRPAHPATPAPPLLQRLPHCLEDSRRGPEPVPGAVVQVSARYARAPHQLTQHAAAALAPAPVPSCPPVRGRSAAAPGRVIPWPPAHALFRPPSLRHFAQKTRIRSGGEAVAAPAQRPWPEDRGPQMAIDLAASCRTGPQVTSCHSPYLRAVPWSYTSWHTVTARQQGAGRDRTALACLSSVAHSRACPSGAWLRASLHTLARANRAPQHHKPPPVLGTARCKHQCKPPLAERACPSVEYGAHPPPFLYLDHICNALDTAGARQAPHHLATAHWQTLRLREQG